MDKSTKLEEVLMSKRFVTSSFGLVLVFVMLASVLGCATKTAEPVSTEAPVVANPTAEPVATEKPAEKVQVNFPTYMCGTNVGKPWFDKTLADFNALYGNEIEVITECLPSDDAYMQKMKVLLASKDVPDIIDGKNGLFDLAVQSGLAIDLLPYVNEDSAWKDALGEGAIAANSRDGKLYSASLAKDIIGYYYNKDIFDKAGITPAQTWDEWFTNMDKIVAAGYTPIALMTGENSWTTNLVLAGIVGGSGEAGNQFMNTMHPMNYSTPEVIEGLTKIQTMLKKYTTKDAVGAKYADATNNFFSGNTAIIANGPWMIGDLSNPEKAPAGFADKVGYAAFPGEGGTGMVTTYREGFMVLSKDKAHADAAVKVVKYFTGLEAQKDNLIMLGIAPLTGNVEISDQFKKDNPIFAELVDAAAKAKWQFKIFDAIDFSNVTPVYGQNYPLMAYGQMTPEEMAADLTKAAEKNK
jgi:raffinose/stachyose/melibiose transport system substrate-binding protein